MKQNKIYHVILWNLLAVPLINQMKKGYYTIYFQVEYVIWNRYSVLTELIINWFRDEIDRQISKLFDLEMNEVFHWSLIPSNKLCMQFVETGKRFPGCLYCRWDRQKITMFIHFCCPWKTKLLDWRARVQA